MVGGASSAVWPLVHRPRSVVHRLFLNYLGTAPEEAGVAVLAPNSRGNTWDAIGGSFGPDVKFLNRAGSLQIRRCHAAGSRAVLRTATITIVSPSTEK